MARPVFGVGDDDTIGGRGRNPQPPGCREHLVSPLARYQFGVKVSRPTLPADVLEQAGIGRDENESSPI
jgi:hypothetical protein